MVKRLIAIPLVIIFTIAAFTSVYAVDLPQNVVDLPFEVYLTSDLYSGVFPYDFTSGVPYYLAEGKGVYFNSIIQKVSFNIPANTFYSFYVIIRDHSFNNNLFSISPSLVPYRNLEKEFNSNVDLTVINYALYEDSIVVRSIGNENKNCHFFYFENVPSGIYSLIETREYYTSCVGIFIDKVYTVPIPDPDPDPIPPSVFLSDLGMIVESSLSWVTSSVDTITSYPFLLLTVGLFALGAAVSFIGRLLSRD